MVARWLLSISSESVIARLGSSALMPKSIGRIGVQVLPRSRLREIPKVLVFNKADLFSGERRTDLQAGRDALCISATAGTGIQDLLVRIDESLPPALRSDPPAAAPGR